MSINDKIPMLSKMPPSVREFAQYKSVIENCSQKTVEEYTLDLRTFFRYILSQRHGITLDSEEFYDLDLSLIDIEFIKSGYGEDENESCLITRLELSGAQLLAMADASCRMEQRLVEEHDLSDTDVLVVSHHGSKYSNCDVLLAEARAELAVISVGYNYYGHPAEETLEALQTYGYNVLRTDLDGDIEIKIGNSYGKKTWEK